MRKGVTMQGAIEFVEKETLRKRIFKVIKVKTKGFKFNRDDIYDELYV
jgi:hypothetical protein